MVKIKKIQVLLIIVALLMNSAYITNVLADTNGSVSPPSNPGICDEHGPCTDDHDFSSSGNGNGWCGKCGPKYYTYNGGSCAGTDYGGYNCYDWNVNSLITQYYYSTAASTAEMIACGIAGVACYTAGDISTIISAIGCWGSCATSWSGLTSAACAACLMANIGADVLIGIELGELKNVICECLTAECMENCDYSSSSQSGSVSACY